MSKCKHESGTVIKMVEGSLEEKCLSCGEVLYRSEALPTRQALCQCKHGIRGALCLDYHPVEEAQEPQKSAEYLAEEIKDAIDEINIEIKAPFAHKHKLIKAVIADAIRAERERK